MAITKGTPTASSGTNTTSYTLVINSGVQSGDILVLATVNRDSTTNPSVTDNDSGGNAWTLIAAQAANTNGELTIWAKRATSATASKTITCSGNTGSCAGVVQPYRGASLAAIASCFGTPVGESNASADESQAGITTGRAGSMVLHAVGVTSNDTLNVGNRTATDPSSMTEDGEGTSSGGSDCSCSLASNTRAAAGATGTISWSMTNGTTGSIAVELLPAWTPLTADVGSVAITGTAATLKVGRLVSAAAGSHSIAGTAATLSKGTPITASAGSFAITGTAAGLRTTHILTASAGSVAATGTAASLLYGRAVVAAAGSYTITGTDATLVYTQGSTYTLTAGAGSVAVTGTAATLKTGRLVTASAGSHSITGTAATLAPARLVTASSGSISLTGAAASLLVTRFVAASAGSYAVSGAAAALEADRRIAADAGAVSITGTAATLTYEPIGSTYTLTAAPGSFVVAGYDAECAYNNRAGPHSYLRHARSSSAWSVGSRARGGWSPRRTKLR